MPLAAPCLLAALVLAACPAEREEGGGDGADAAQDSALDDATDDGAEADTTADPCVDHPARVPGTDRFVDPLGVVTTSITERAACARTYRVESSATRRDDLPVSPRVVVERAGDPRVRTGHDLFDALHALAVEEAHENEVDNVSDGAFAGGEASSCGDDGCYVTGRKWTYVWTRDTAFAIDLGLAALDPARSAGSLRFKLSRRRDGGPLRIVQDTGSGGSWPVSTDRVVWALGARAVLGQLEGEARVAFRDAAFEALATTLEQDRDVVYDPSTGLYRGETSFLDWREQTYAGWTQHDVIDIATSAALGTNVLHLHALRLAAELAREVGDLRATTWEAWAEALREAIRARFWLEDEGLFSSFLPSTLDPAPVRRFDLLASSLAILHGVATPEEARRMMSAYPHHGPAAAVIWPQQQYTAIYHNRAEWPFVDAYWLAAARVARHDAASERMVRALMRGAALNLSNMENLEVTTGAPWVVDDAWSGPVVNSQRQLWSVAGYLHMVHAVLFGLAATPSGLAIEPWITRGLRRELFAGTDRLVLEGFPHRGRRLTVIVSLPPRPSDDGDGAYRVVALEVDGRARDLAAGLVVPDAELGASTRIHVTLGEDPSVTASALREVPAPTPDTWRALYGPRTPQIRAVTAEAGKLRLELGLGGESPDGLALSIYRDGVRVADGLPGDTAAWVDPESDANAPRSPCYAAEATFVTTGNHSQHSRAACWWGEGDSAIQLIGAESFEANGGTLVEEYGRLHYQGWGDPGHTLTLSGLRPTRDGAHLLQVTYGNGAGPINTGIACGVKRVTVIDEASGATIGGGVLVMPQLGRWDRWALSSFVPVTLSSGGRYRVVISSDAATTNMSTLAHFAAYSGAAGGADGPFSRVNIAELRLLAR